MNEKVAPATDAEIAQAMRSIEQNETRESVPWSDGTVLALIARIDAERLARKKAEDSEEMSFGCFRMIAEDLHHFDPTTPIKSVPPMFLNDWLRKVVVVYKRHIADLEAEIAKLKASAT